MGSGTFALGFRVARSLYSRWRILAPRERERLAHLAEHAKERALELRGAADRQAAERELAAANETLAAAIVESAESDPDVSASEVQGLRDELRRELERLASAEVKASRASAVPQGRAG
jgi:hypothetical protein